MDATKYLRIKDAAARLGISRQAVHSLCERGLLPGAIRPLGEGTPWLIPPSAVAARKKKMAAGRLPKGGRLAKHKEPTNAKP